MTRIVFGTAAVGQAYGLPRTDGARDALAAGDAVALVRHALARGVTTFDTAPAYGEAERRVGEALAGQDASLWTKVSGDVRDASASLDRSLHALRAPRVGLVQWHNWTRSLREDRAWCDAFASLRGARAGALGATTYGVDDAAAAVESGLFEVVQVEWNVLNRSVVDAIAERAAARRVRVAVRSVYLQGALTDEGRALPDAPALRDGVAATRRLANDLGLGVTELALRAALSEPAIAHVVLGFDSTRQVDDALALEGRGALPPDMSARARALDLGGAPGTDPRRWKELRA